MVTQGPVPLCPVRGAAGRVRFATPFWIPALKNVTLDPSPCHTITTHLSDFESKKKAYNPF